MIARKNKIKNSKVILRFFFSFTVILSLISAVVFLSCNSGHRLFDLQQRIQQEDSVLKKRTIIDRLDQYYLTMDVADSIQATVDECVGERMRKHPMDLPSISIIQNPYVLEKKMDRTLRQVVILRIRGDEQTFFRSIEALLPLADSLDHWSENDYWRSWIEKIRDMDSLRAKQWLSACMAESLCTINHLTDFASAEQYAALGLNYLQSVHDSRLRLDIMQRLVTILFNSRVLCDLSHHLAERETEIAGQIKYRLREIGLLYNDAEAIWISGDSQSALNKYRETIDKIQEYREVPHVSWYENASLLGAAKANWRMGNYVQAIDICNALEKKELVMAQKISLCMTKGITYRNLGNYDSAEKEYFKALRLTETTGDFSNHCVALQNLGSMYFRLTEYDMAGHYFERGIEMLEQHCHHLIDIRCSLLLSQAEVTLAQKDVIGYKALIEEVSELVEWLQFPTKKAELSRSLGQLNMKTNRYEEAYENLTRALKIYEQYGLKRASMETKIYIVHCLLSLSRLDEARNKLTDVFNCAELQKDAQCLIDAHGYGARLEQRLGRIDEAIRQSNRLIVKIESLNRLFLDVDHLTIFQQKINDFLRDAVRYELKKGRIDSAFVKLDYMKARALKNHMNHADTASCYIDLKKIMTHLRENQTVINYFITQDTLYAFVINRLNLHIFRRAISSQQLTQLVQDYLSSIRQTTTVFVNLRSDLIEAHYNIISNLSVRLNDLLMGWPELRELILKTELTYIIADEILYQLPFGTLLDANQTDSQYLIEKSAIVNLPSCCFLQANDEHDLRGQKALFFIDHRFPGAKDMAILLEKIFPYSENLRIDEPEISKQDILDRIDRGFDIYVFYCHSSSNHIMPDSCFLELMGSNGLDNSPPGIRLYLSEIKRMNWSAAKLVVLLGCETADGKLYHGTGLAGIQQGLLTLGADEVLASLWKIDAQYAMTQTIRFFKSWIYLKQTALALREVQMNSIHELEKDVLYRVPNPFYWASLNLYQTTN